MMFHRLLTQLITLCTNCPWARCCASSRSSACSRSSKWSSARPKQLIIESSEILLVILTNITTESSRTTPWCIWAPPSSRSFGCCSWLSSGSQQPEARKHGPKQLHKICFCRSSYSHENGRGSYYYANISGNLGQDLTARGLDATRARGDTATGVAG